MRRVVPLLLLLTAGCGHAEWREADTRLASAAQAARDLGFVPMSGPNNTFGDFASHGEVAWRVSLDPGRSYFLAAACTTGCATLDFSIADPRGGELARDSSAGTAPRLVFTPPVEGDYRVTFRYGACSAERCRWIAQLYDRRSTD